MRELEIPVGEGVARVPFPMTAEDYDMLIGTLHLWRHKLAPTHIPFVASPATVSEAAPKFQVDTRPTKRPEPPAEVNRAITEKVGKSDPWAVPLPSTFPNGKEIAPPKSAPNEKSNGNLGPMHPASVAIGRTLNDPWTNTDLEARLDGDRSRSYQWVAAWKRKGWIETVGFGQYKKTDSFGL